MFVAVLACVLVADQLTKALIRMWLEVGRSVPIVPDVLEIAHVRNEGAAFGLLPGQRTVFMSTSVLVIVGILVYMLWRRPRWGWLVVSLALVAAGAAGNLIDRLTTGLVTDFIDVFAHLFPVFNVADSSIVIGVGMLMLWVLLGPEGDEAVS